MQLRLPSRTPGTGRDRRDPLLHLPLIRVDRGGRHQGVLRRNLACRCSRPAAGQSRGQAHPAPGQGVPQGWHPQPRGRRAAPDHRHAPRRDSLPLLSNLALSVLNEHFAAAWESFATDWARRSRRSKGLANYRLVRYADDWVVLVAGDRPRRSAARSGGGGPHHDGPAPIAGEGANRAHRRGL